jgi:uncharacterized glyoxalase superfamily protein PhnB
MAKKTAKKKAPARRKAPVRKPAAKRAKAQGGVPQGMHTVVAQLVFKESGKAIEFYKQAFGAKELMLMPSPDGKSVWHAEIRIGNSVIFLSDESPQGICVAPSPTHRPTASIQLYVPDCDAVFNSAVQAGARVTMPLADMFWGDRFGMVTDPFGQLWAIATRVKDLSVAEMSKAGAEWAAKNPPPQTQAN